MNSRRTAKAASAIRQVVSSSILFELRDPRVRNLTVLGVEAAEDMRSAKVTVSVMGDAAAQRLALHGLDSARGFLQSRLADELGLRYTPILKFELSQGVKQSVAVSRLLREINHQVGDTGADDEANNSNDDPHPNSGDDADSE